MLLVAVAFCEESTDSNSNIKYKNPNQPEGNSNSSFSDIPNDYKNPENLKYEGQILFDQERYEDALISFKKAQILSPDDLELQYYLGISYLMLGDMDNAEFVLNQSLYSNVTPEAYFYHGLATFALNNTSQSIVSFKKYLQIFPNDSYAWFNIGQAYEAEFEHNNAIDAYKSAIAIDPTYAKPWFCLGTIYHYQGDSNKAIQAIQNYSQIIPEDDTAWFFLSSRYHENGKMNESIYAMQKAQAIRPNYQFYQKFLDQNTSNASTKENEIGELLYTPLSPILPIISLILSVMVAIYRR